MAIPFICWSPREKKKEESTGRQSLTGSLASAMPATDMFYSELYQLSTLRIVAQIFQYTNYL